MYALQQNFLDSASAVPLTKERYEDIIKSKTNLVGALEIEHKFDMLIRNYEELEAEFLKISLRTAIHGERAWDVGIDMLQEINRRITNVLTTARLYLDQVPHELTLAFGKNSLQQAQFKTSTTRAYDEHFGYRVCEALRNYVQHRGMPCQRIERCTSQAEKSERTRSHCNVYVRSLLQRHVLEGDGKFKASIMTELNKLEEDPDLKLLVREYVQGLGTVHSATRDLLAESIASWEASVSEAVTHYQDVRGEDVTGLRLVELDGQIVISHTDLAGDINISGRRRELVARNRSTSHLSHMVATNY